MTTILRLPSGFTPADDELFFSLCNRVMPRTGMPSSHGFSLRISGQEWGTYMLARRAPQGLSAMADLLSCSSLELLTKHTLIPYFESASPVGLSEQQVQLLCSHDHPNSRYRTASWKRQPLQHCVECVNEDLELIGEPVWRRSHQLPGVLVCVKHRAWLVHQCSVCQWASSERKLRYPPTACPAGHAFVARKPLESLDLSVELKFARWSSELLSYPIGARTLTLRTTLRTLARRRGLGAWYRDVDRPDSLAEAYTSGLRDAVLLNARTLVERVSNPVFRHLLTPALSSQHCHRPHPAEMMLCVKALVGTKVSVPVALLSAEPADPSSWSARYHRSRRMDPAEREKLLVSFVEERAHLQQASSTNAMDEALGKELGLSRSGFGLWRRQLCKVAQALRKARPDLY
ncbi:TniQ family protein [Roseateles sp. LYH14W]|uniref:TniQ family protein n=1 Tax=Pelomonas parva TaxID=3299032 RepID=A0ABW7FCB0_9BURK